VQVEETTPLNDAEAGGALILRRKPDVALVDLALPGMSGAELTRSLLKEDPDRTVAAGGDYIDPRLTPLLAEGGNGRTKRLSPREREILGLLSQGLSGEEVAKELYLSSETVRAHVRNAMGKLGAATRAHAVALALQHGEISP
jgi:DNA-binding NarL/FixJ family response regulator